MSAPKAEKFPIQLMSLKAIKVDHALQSRVKMSVEDQREFSECMLQGDDFPPVTLFYDGKKYWLADGFHRFAAAVKAQFDSIKAEVRHGTRRDAMIFSAGANKKFCIKRTPADIKKAAWMLLDDDEWRKASPLALAKHVGCHIDTMRRHINDYFDHNNIEPPPMTVQTAGASNAPHTRTVSRTAARKSGEQGLAARAKHVGRPIGISMNGIAHSNTSVESLMIPHSRLPRDEAIAEARRIGDGSEGNGWRRLLWRMADLLESENGGEVTVPDPSP